jgi:hypothetical protein
MLALTHAFRASPREFSSDLVRVRVSVLTVDIKDDNQAVVAPAGPTPAAAGPAPAAASAAMAPASSSSHSQLQAQQQPQPAIPEKSEKRRDFETTEEERELRSESGNKTAFVPKPPAGPVPMGSSPSSLPHHASIISLC